MPSVVVDNFGQGLEFNIRGIGKAEHNTQTSTGVITYRDGVATFPGYLQEEPYYDLASVEVLRGPQGTIAGENSTGGIFGIRGGFWLPSVAPSAASVSVSGQVKTAQGSGIRNVSVTLTDSSGTVRTTRTGTFGYFRFDDITAGGTYIFSVAARHYQFSQPTIIRAVQEEIADLEFIGTEL